MRSSSAITVNDVRILIASLVKTKEYTQTSISQATGIDQSVISRLLSGEHKRLTANLRELHKYAIMQTKKQGVPADLLAQVKAFLSTGGEPEVLIRQLRLLQEVQLRGRGAASY